MPLSKPEGPTEAGGRQSAAPGVFEGPLLARVSGLYLELSAVALGFGVAMISITAWWLARTLFQQPMHPRVIVAGVVVQLLILPGVWLGVRLLWLRGRAILELRAPQQQSPRVMAMLMGTAADFGALAFTFSSLAVGLAVAIAGDRLALLSPELANQLAGYSPLLQGLGFAFLGLLIVVMGLSLAAACLLVLRFFAESIILGLQVADDTAVIRHHMAGEHTNRQTREPSKHHNDNTD